MEFNLEDKLIEVCSECGTASCYYFEFVCTEARGADTEQKTVNELRLLGIEHPENWSDEKMLNIYGDAAPFGYKHMTAPHWSNRFWDKIGSYDYAEIKPPPEWAKVSANRHQKIKWYGY